MHTLSATAEISVILITANITMFDRNISKDL